MGNGFVILTAYVLACCGQNEMSHQARRIAPSPGVGLSRVGHNTIHTLCIYRYKLWEMDL